MAELLATVDSDELTEWIAAWQMGLLDDWKPVRDVIDYASAGICATIANVNRSSDTRAYSLFDFTLFAEKPERDPADLDAELEAAFTERAING